MTDPPPRRRFGAGVVDALPLWLGVVPFGVVYAVVGRRAGLSAWEIQVMSLLVYAGGAQFTAVRLLAQGAPRSVLVVATALINLRHVLYGLSLAQPLREARPGLRGVVAFFLVDESYGLGTRAYLDGRGSVAYLLGAGISLYVAWNVGTALGAVVTAAVPDPRSAGLDLVFPLTFAALLAPLLRGPANRQAAAASFLAALVSVPRLPGGAGFVVATVLGMLCGLRAHD
ncbi:MAG TPA: AzlC family ABC transporter permease [bacterium]|nr:AzlC family ABC transporter permease [bacterium]